MSIHISEQTEARLTREAQRQGLSVNALIERLIDEGDATTPIASSQPDRPTVFEQGLGMFGSAEDAAIIDDVVALAYAERQRPGKEQPIDL